MLLYEVLCHRFCKSPAGLNLLNTIIHNNFIVLNIAFYILCSEICWCFLATQGSFTEVYKLSVVLLLGLSLPNRISSQEKNTSSQYYLQEIIKYPDKRRTLYMTLGPRF